MKVAIKFQLKSLKIIILNIADGIRKSVITQILTWDKIKILTNETKCGYLKQYMNQNYWVFYFIIDGTVKL